MKRLSVAVLLATLLATPALAAPKTSSDNSQPDISSKAPLFTRSSKSPDVNAIPFFAKITKAGGKFYYLGERSGLHGWIVRLNDKIQLMYAPADGSTVMVGAMLTGEGKNVSGPQIEILSETEKEIAALMDGSKAENKTAPAGENIDEGHVNNPPKSPGEQILRDFQEAAGVVMGHNESAQVSMLVRMDNGESKAAWNLLKPAINSGDLQIKLIPTADALRDDEQRAAALLAAANPMEAWDKYVNGDKSSLSGKAEDAGIKAVRSNFSLIEKWKIKVMPYMVYRSKDGAVKILQGRPEDSRALLSDLAK